MDSINSFNFGCKSIRLVLVAGETHWVAKDVAEALGYTWNGSSRIAHVPPEWRGVTSVGTPSGPQEMAILTEPGLFFFLNRSDKPAALPMQKWVAGEVLPSIRKTGAYAVTPTFKAPEDLEEALLMAAAVERQRKALARQVEAQAEEIKILEPMAATAQAITDAQGAQSFDQAAKVLGTGPNRLFSLLREWRWIKPGTTLPYQEHVDNGNFIVRERLFQDAHKVDRLQQKTYITGKGLCAIQKRMTAGNQGLLVKPQHRG